MRISSDIFSRNQKSVCVEKPSLVIVWDECRLKPTAAPKKYPLLVKQLKGHRGQACRIYIFDQNNINKQFEKMTCLDDLTKHHGSLGRGKFNCYAQLTIVLGIIPS